MKQYFHFCSRGFTREVLFANEAEFVAAMNRIGVCLTIARSRGLIVTIVAFCLMDNHFHFIVYGEEQACSCFAETYKKLTSMWVAKYRGSALSEHIELGHWPIAFNKLAEKIIYVLRNPVAAGIKVTPWGYRWSSGMLMFNETSVAQAESVRISDFSGRDKLKHFYTAIEMPDDWLICKAPANREIQDPMYMIWPGCYTDYKTAEKQFPSIGRFMFDLNNSNIDKEVEEEMTAGSFSVPDGDVRLRAVELCLELYRKDRIATCSAQERLAVARLLKREMGCNAKQLARVFRLDVQDLSKLV